MTQKHDDIKTKIDIDLYFLGVETKEQREVIANYIINDKYSVSTYNDGKCTKCGASMKMYWQSLTPGLAKVLLKFHNGVRQFGNCLNPGKDIGLNKSEYNNFQKLRFHGLVAKVRKDDGSHDTGYWLLTRRGSQFVNNEIEIPKKVQTFRNKIVGYSNERVSIADILGNERLPYWQEINDYEYEYANEIHITSSNLS